MPHYIVNNTQLKKIHIGRVNRMTILDFLLSYVTHKHFAIDNVDVNLGYLLKNYKLI